MAESIKKTDLAANDVLANLIPTQAQIDMINKADESTARWAATVKNSLVNDKSSLAALQKQAELQGQLNVITKARIKTDNDKIKLQNQLKLATDEEVKGKLRLQKVNAEQRKSLKAEIILNDKLAGTEEKLLAANTKLRIERSKLNLDTKKGTTELKRINAELDKNNARIRESGDAMKKQSLNVGNYGGAISKLTGLLKRLGLAFGVFQLIKKSFSVFADFDEKLADIQKTTGLSKDAVKELSLELLKIDTRTSVNELQELAAAAGRLGLAEKDIVGFVKSADKVFIALGDDLSGSAEEIATDLGKIAANFNLIDQFGVEGSIERVGSVMNELAANSKAGAGAIFDFTNRMAGVASVANISQNDIQALGALFDSTGQSIEVASSTLAKLLPALSKDQERFAKIAGLTADEYSRMLAESPIEALKAVAVGAKSSEDGLDGLVSTLESFGIESARSAGIVGVLANSTEELTRLQNIANKAFSENTSIANEARIKNETLNAAVEKLQKAWDTLIIKFNEGTGTFDFLKDAIGFLADNLEVIVKWFLVLGTVFGVYSLINKTAKAFKALNLAMNANPFILVASVLAGLVVSLGLFNDEMSEAEKQSEALNKQIKEEAEAVSNASAEFVGLTESLKHTVAGSVERSRLITEINDKFGTTLKNLKDEKLFQDQVNVAVSNYIGLQKQRVLAERNQGKINEQLLIQIDAEEKIFKIESKLKKAQRKGESLGDVRKRFSLDNDQLLIYEKKLRMATEALKVLGQTGLDIMKTQDLLIEPTTPNVDDPTLTTTTTKKQKTAEEIAIEALTEYKKKKALEFLEYENWLIENNYSREKIDAWLAEKELEDARDIGDKIIDLGLENDAVMIEHRNDYLKKVEKLRLDHIKTTSDQDKEANAEDLAAFVKDLTDKENARLEAENARLEAEKKKEEQLAELRKKTLDEIAEAADALLDKNIERLNKERDAAENQQSYLQDLAASGNITAKESLKAEIEAQREAEKEIMEMERKKATLKLVTTGLNTFSSEINSGKSPAEAFTSTLVSIEALKTVLSGMNFFAKGTDNAPKGMAVVDELGAEIHLDRSGNIKSLGSDSGANLRQLDRGDKIITADKSKNILNYISKIEQPNKKGAASLGGNNFEMIKELKNINSTIKNQTSSTEFDIVYGEIIRKTSNNGVRIKSRYRS